MNICPNCQTKTKGNFCSACGNPTVALPKKEKSGITVSGVISLLILAIFLFLAPVGAIADFVECGGSFGHRLSHAIAVVAAMLIFGIWFWGYLRFCVYAIPGTFRAAKKVLTSVIPLSLFAAAAELIFGIWLALIPLSLYGATVTPLYQLIRTMQQGSISFVVLLLILAASVLAFACVVRRELRPFIRRFGAKKEQAVPA